MNFKINLKIEFVIKIRELLMLPNKVLWKFQQLLPNFPPKWATYLLVC
jgi:hypothetical protein